MPRFTRYFTAVLAIIYIIVVLAGCSPQGEVIEEKLESESESPVTVKDALGREIKVSQPPNRIISLAPSHTEILYALDLQDKLVGVTDYCDFPAEAKDKEKVGGYVEPSLEKIIELEPQLVVGARHHEELIEYLEPLDIKIYLHEPRQIEELWDTIENIGILTGQEQEAEALTSTLEDNMKAITEKTSAILQDEQPTVFFEVWHDPLTAAGGGTLIDELIGLAGGVNIAEGEEGYPQFSLEVLIEKNPEVYLATSGSMSSPGDLTERPGWEALEEARINIFEDENLIYRCGPRVIQGLEKMALFLHPELFD